MDRAPLLDDVAAWQAGLLDPDQALRLFARIVREGAAADLGGGVLRIVCRLLAAGLVTEDGRVVEEVDDAREAAADQLGRGAWTCAA